MPSRRANFPTAFTLIELILVLAIIAILASIAIPAVATFEKHQRCGETSADIVALARWARTQAISQGVAYRLNFNTATGGYWLTVQNGASYENVYQDTQSGSLGLPGGSQTTTMFNAMGEEIGRQFTAPAGVSFTSTIAPQPDGQYIEFRPTGRSDPGTIVLSDGAGQTIEVGSLSATEDYHVFSAEERQLEQSLQQPPGAAAR